MNHDWLHALDATDVEQRSQVRVPRALATSFERVISVPAHAGSPLRATPAPRFACFPARSLPSIRKSQSTELPPPLGTRRQFSAKSIVTSRICSSEPAPAKIRHAEFSPQRPRVPAPLPLRCSSVLPATPSSDLLVRRPGGVQHTALSRVCDRVRCTEPPALDDRSESPITHPSHCIPISCRVVFREEPLRRRVGLSMTTIRTLGSQRLDAGFQGSRGGASGVENVFGA